MRIDMARWARGLIASDAVAALPVMTVPGLPLAGETVRALIGDGEAQARCVKALVAAVQDDAFLVVLHNCGPTVPLGPSMVSTGARALHFGNSVAMADVVTQVPPDRLVCGNVNPSGTFRLGNPESMAQEVGSLLRSMEPYPNFVLSSGCDVPPGTPLENVDAFFAALAAHGAERRARSAAS